MASSQESSSSSTSSSYDNQAPSLMRAITKNGNRKENIIPMRSSGSSSRSSRYNFPVPSIVPSRNSSAEKAGTSYEKSETSVEKPETSAKKPSPTSKVIYPSTSSDKPRKPRPILKREWVLSMEAELLPPISEAAEITEKYFASLAARNSSRDLSVSELETTKTSNDNQSVDSSKTITASPTNRGGSSTSAKSYHSYRSRIFKNSRWGSKEQKPSSSDAEEAEEVKIRAEYYPLPKHFDNFVLQEMIGKGSFAHVYKAVHRSTKEAIAIKTFRVRLTHYNYFSRVATEIVFLRILDHPNIVAYRCSNIKKQSTYIGMEYTGFGCLSNFMIRHVGLKESLVQNVMSQLIAAIYYLHTMCILHGDIKPDNILVAEVNKALTIKLSDFGLASVTLKDQVYRKRFGSFFYMAPEIHLRYPSDCKSDLFSVGVVMYEMLFGMKPFPTDMKREQYVKNLRRRMVVKFPANQARLLTPECLNVVKNLLSYDKHKRYSSVDLLNHPFLNFEPKTDRRDHFLIAYECFLQGADLVEARNYGPAYIELTAAVLHLQIHSTRIRDPDIHKYIYLKIEKYNIYIHMIEDRLLDDTTESLHMPKDNETLRCLLQGSPELLCGFDLCSMGEVYSGAKYIERGIEMLKRGIEILTPKTRIEPEGQRKKLLVRMIEEWRKVLAEAQAALLDKRASLVRGM